jgi:hypothetical protein
MSGKGGRLPSISHIKRVCRRCKADITYYNTKAGRPERRGMELCGKCYLAVKAEERKAKGLA